VLDRIIEVKRETRLLPGARPIGDPVGPRIIEKNRRRRVGPGIQRRLAIACSRNPREWQTQLELQTKFELECGDEGGEF
jgi:hypothetical protein